MNHVVAHVHAEVATDGAGVGVSAVGGADEFASDGNGFNTLPGHANDGSGGHEFDEAWEEGALLVDIVVGTSDFFGRHHGLQADEFEAFSLKSSNNFADEASLHAVGFDHNIGRFHGVHRTDPKVTRLWALLWGCAHVSVH